MNDCVSHHDAYDAHVLSCADSTFAYVHVHVNVCHIEVTGQHYSFFVHWAILQEIYIFAAFRQSVK